MVCNGVLAGLVGITAGCDCVSIGAAALIGLVCSLLMCVSVWFIDQKLHIDDPVGAVSVHGVGGINRYYPHGTLCRAGGRRQPVGASGGGTHRGSICLPCRTDSLLRYPLHLRLARGSSHRGRGARHLRARRNRLQLTNPNQYTKKIVARFVQKAGNYCIVVAV